MKRFGLTLFVAPVIALALPVAALAQSGGPCIYRDADGNTVITDDPADPNCPGARKAEFKPPGRLVMSFEVAEVVALAHAAATRHEIDHRLVESLVEMESGFDVRAVSPKGALGLMQLMPDVARAYGVADPFNAWDNLDAGVRHLRDLLVRYDGDLELALAAYNAGTGAVDRSAGIPPYAETQDYVRRVLFRYRQRVAGAPLH